MDYGAIITALTAAVVLIGTIVTFFKNNSISKEAVERTALAETTLKAEHALLLERSADTKTSVSSMCGIIQEDRLQRTKEQAEQKIQYASLSDAQKRLDDHAREIGKFADEFRRLAAENAELRAENQRLRDRYRLFDEEIGKQRNQARTNRQDELEL